MSSLRTRLLEHGLSCQPWATWKHELQYLPVSSRTLFRNEGLPVDLAEMDLKREGWLRDDETLLVVLADAHNLKRKRFGEESARMVDITDAWTEEDFEYAEREREIRRQFF